MNQKYKIAFLALLLSINSSNTSFAMEIENQNTSNKRRATEELDNSHLKAPRLGNVEFNDNKEILPNIETQKVKKSDYKSQIYSIPTFDATFKYMLSENKICLSFLETFALNEPITSIKFLDDHLRPTQKYQNVFNLVNHKDTKDVISRITNLVDEEEATEDSFKITYMEKQQTTNKKEVSKPKKTYIQNGGWFIKSSADIYGDLISAFPIPERNSQVDLLCELQDGSLILAEVQVIPQNFWDQRALAYAADLYTRQLKVGSQWSDLKKVICINILGGGKDSIKWHHPKKFKHFLFKDQDNSAISSGIEIFQYPLYYSDTFEEASKSLKDELRKTALKDWLELLENAGRKQQEEVEFVKTSSVRDAYDRIKIEKLPKEVQAENLKQAEDMFESYSQYTETLTTEARKTGEQIGLEKGKAEEKKNMARKMLTLGISVKDTCEVTGLSENEIKDI